jgi:hypothetical protein
MNDFRITIWLVAMATALNEVFSVMEQKIAMMGLTKTLAVLSL